MEQPPTRPGSELLLRHSSFLLTQRDFTNSRKFALLAQQSDPNLSGPDQILAVTNVLIAAKRRLHNHHLDLYSILQIPEPGPDTRPDIQTRFEKLSSLLNPMKNKLPFTEEAFKLVCDAWSVLSDPDKKTQYDNEINNGCNVHVVNGYGCNPEKAEKTTQESRWKENEGNDSGTFWTVCPYCYYMFEYEKKYEECALRCRNCRRVFHGVAVEAPRTVVVEGKKEFYCGYGVFPLGYRLGGDFLGHKKAKKSGDFDGGRDNVVEISDDSDEEKGMDVEGSGSVDGGEENNVAKEEVVKGGSEKIEVTNDGKRVMMKFKSVARKSKKIMGKGVKSRRTESMGGPRTGRVGFGNGDGGNGNGIWAGSGNGNGGGCFEDEVESF